VVTKLWSVFCITQKRKEDAMKTKTNVKAGTMRMSK
jgi:hypothetical protein